MPKGNDSIGALWPNMSERSDPATYAERYANTARNRETAAPVLHEVHFHFERVDPHWRVWITDSNHQQLWQRHHNDSLKIETIATRGNAFTCLADRQAFDLGISNGRGMIKLRLTADQLAGLENPR